MSPKTGARFGYTRGLAVARTHEVVPRDAPLMSAAPSLKDLLASVRPRDLSGSRASNRFAYQRDWTLALLLHVHDQHDDYLVVLDYHDDVVLLDSSVNPAKGTFFQIKTNRGNNWTIAQLLKRKPGKSGPLPSFLGKLWSHQVSFAPADCDCYFVTNGLLPFCPLSTTNDLGDATECALLKADEYKKLATDIQTELQLATEPDLKKKLIFLRSPLSVQDHADHVAGKLTAFITARHPTGKFRASAAYRAIADEVGRCANREGAFDTFESISTHKGITRARFEEMLVTVGASDDLDATWSRYDTELSNEGVAFSEREAIHQAWRQFEIQRMDVADEEVRTLVQRARAAIEKYRSDARSFTLNKLVEECATAIDSPAYPAPYLKAVVLMEYYHVSKLQAPGPQSKAEAP
jgi:hypothetical protein